MSLLNLLKRFMNDELANEGITPELLEVVDLDVEFSPVLPFPGDDITDTVTVRPWGFVADDALPKTFEVMHPLVRSPTTRDELKVMRARYLLARDAYYGEHGSLAIGGLQR